MEWSRAANIIRMCFYFQDLGQLGKTGIDPNLSWEIRYRMEEEEKNMYKTKAEEYKIQVIVCTVYFHLIHTLHLPTINLFEISMK